MYCKYHMNPLVDLIRSKKSNPKLHEQYEWTCHRPFEKEIATDLVALKKLYAQNSMCSWVIDFEFISLSSGN